MTASLTEHCREGIVSELGIWRSGAVWPDERKIYIGTSDTGLPLYFLPKRNTVARYVAANYGWQVLTNPTEK